MWRFFAGVAACFLMMTGAFLMWQSKAQEPALPGSPAVAAPAVATSGGVPTGLTFRKPPVASEKSREEKRFARADKDEDGKVTASELFEPRRKAFAKLDKDGNGALSFEEWATKTVSKFAEADADRSGWLTAAEFAKTAPKAPKRKAVCSC